MATPPPPRTPPAATPAEPPNTPVGRPHASAEPQSASDLAPDFTPAIAGLEALRSRLGQMLLAAAPETDGHREAVEHLGRRAQQIRAYIESSRAALAAAGRRRAPATSLDSVAEPLFRGVPLRPVVDPQTLIDRLHADTARLIAALDVSLDAPGSAAPRALLEQTLDAVIGPLPEIAVARGDPAVPRDTAGAVSPPLKQALHTSRTQQPDAPTRADLYRLDEAERAWWRSRIERLQRQFTFSVLLSVATLIGLVALYLDAGQHWSSSATPSSASTPVSSPGYPTPQLPSGGPADSLSADLHHGAEALYQLLLQLGTTPEGLAALVEDWSAGPAATLDAVRDRTAELDLKMMQLDARLGAWEVSQSPSPGKPADPSPAQQIDPASPAEPTLALDPNAPAFGIQLATLRSHEALLTLAQKSGLHSATLFVETTGSQQRLILGFYPSAAQAKAALTALPAPLRKSRPIVRAFQGSADLAPLESPPSTPASADMQ